MWSWRITGPGGTALSTVLHFQGFTLRVTDRVLLREGQPVAIKPRAFDVLAALAAHSDRLVSRDELILGVWGPDRDVGDNNLTVQITEVRKVLGADAVINVPGRGYKLNARPLAMTEAAPPPERARLTRRLAAVAHADVVGWLRLVSRDPEAAARAWQAVRNGLLARCASQHGGTLQDVAPGRVLLEFASVVDALDWALALQAALAAHRAESEAGNTLGLHMRIGLTVDDVIVVDGKLVGEGVNLALDLQSSAGHDEVLVTQKVCDFLHGRPELQFHPLGERRMPSTGGGVQVFRAAPARQVVATPSAMPLLRAALAVLPFATEATTASYIGEGITEEIIAALSMNRALFVIAHGSTLRYRDHQGPPAEVADELGVRYLVSGSVRRAGDQLRIHVTLLHAADARILWQQRFQGSMQQLFSVQSEIAASVAAAVAPPLQDEEVALVRQRPTQSDGAYDCMLRALAGIWQLGTQAFDEAGGHLQRAIALDPGYAQAHAHLAWWYSLRAAEGRTATPADDVRLGLQHALKAEQLDPRDAMVLSVAGYLVSLQERKHQLAMDLFERALSIDPSCAAAWARSGATLMYLGRADESLARMQRAMQLSPFDQLMFWHFTICGGACFVARRYDEAAAWLGKALRLHPRFNGARRMQIAALVRCGDLDDARELAQALLADVPDFSIQGFAAISALPRHALDDMLQALGSAGLPP